MLVSCEQCGKETRKVPAKVMAHIFCGRTCFGLWRREHSVMTDELRERISQALIGRPNPRMAEMARQQVGEKHPRWVGDNSTRHTGHRRAEKAFSPGACDVCAKPYTGGHSVERHHKDGNSLNNGPQNVAFLCPKDHKAAEKVIRETREGASRCHLSAG